MFTISARSAKSLFTDQVIVKNLQISAFAPFARTRPLSKTVRESPVVTGWGKHLSWHMAYALATTVGAFANKVSRGQRA